MPRELRPRATDALAIVPAVVTDRSAAAVVGLEAREFRELVAAKRIRHVRAGHRVIVRLDVFLEALQQHAADESAAEAPSSGPRTVDQVLATVGRRRAR